MLRGGVLESLTNAGLRSHQTDLASETVNGELYLALCLPGKTFNLTRLLFVGSIHFGDFEPDRKK